MHRTTALFILVVFVACKQNKTQQAATEHHNLHPPERIGYTSSPPPTQSDSGQGVSALAYYDGEDSNEETYAVRTLEKETKKDADFNSIKVFKLKNTSSKKVVALKFMYLFSNPKQEVEWLVRKSMQPMTTLEVKLTPTADTKLDNGRFVNAYLQEVVFEDGSFEKH